MNSEASQKFKRALGWEDEAKVDADIEACTRPVKDWAHAPVGKGITAFVYVQGRLCRLNFELDLDVKDSDKSFPIAEK